MATEGDAIKALLDKFGHSVVEAAMRNLGAVRTVNGKKRRSVATGTLKENLTFKNRTRYNNPILEFTAKGKAKEYAGVVHDGRRVGATPPPLAPILEWMRIKPIRLRNADGGFVKISDAKVTKGKFTGLNAQKVNAARRISKAIGKRGIPANPYFSDAITSELEKYGPEFLAALKKEIELRLTI